MRTRSFQLFLWAPRLSVARLAPEAPFPDWAIDSPFLALVRTPRELSVICEESRVPPGTRGTGGWRALEVAGPLDFGEVGILAELSGILARAGVSLFAVSTHDTDYLLVPTADLDGAVESLEEAGHRVGRRSTPGPE